MGDPLSFHDGQQLSMLGRSFTLHISEGSGRSSKARAQDNSVSIELAGNLNWRQKAKHVRILSVRVLSKCVLPEVMRRVGELNDAHFKFKLDNVKVKHQSTRWGSYSKRTNSIYLNFRLLFAPPEVLDYVIVHELAHIKELNHSRDFWKLVAAAVPEYKERRKWLRKNCNKFGTNTAYAASVIQAPVNETQEKDKYEGNEV